MTENKEEACCSKSLSENNKYRSKKRRPESSNDDSIDRSHRKKDTLTVQMNKCKRLLSNLRTAKEHSEYTHLFNYPVDPVAFKCPDYYDVIKNPMDLSTMQIKMKKGKYKTPDDFEADIRLIFDNALTYNGSEHAIVPIVEKFRKAFDCRFQKIVNPKPRSDQLLMSASQIAKRMSGRSFIYIPEDEELLFKEITKTQKFLRKLYEKYKSLLEARGEQFDINDPLLPHAHSKPMKRIKKNDSNKSNKNVKKESKAKIGLDLKEQRHLSSSSDDEDNQQPMTYDEKRELVLNINKLPSEKIQEISQIVKSTDPECYKELENNFEINFTECKLKTLRVLKKITDEFFRPKRGRAVPLPRKEKLEKDKKLVQNLKVDLENQKKDYETKLAAVEEKLTGFIRKKAKSPEPTQTALNSSTSSGSSSTSSSSSSSSSSSDSSDDDGFRN